MTEFIKAREADSPVIASLRQRIWACTYRGIYPDGMIDGFDLSWHTARDLARIRSEIYLVFLIRISGQNVGYLTVKKGTPLLLLSLYILPEFQGRGAGRAAFQKVREICGEAGQKTFLCQCQPQNKPAMAFYEKMGGRITARDLGNAESWQDSVTFSFSA